jgi:hypothetical protein
LVRAIWTPQPMSTPMAYGTTASATKRTPPIGMPNRMDIRHEGCVVDADLEIAEMACLAQRVGFDLDRPRVD